MILFKVTYDINQSVSKPRLVNILPLPSNFLLKKKKNLLDIQNANSSKNNVMSIQVHDVHFVDLLSNINS